jgi:[protein-PII] uridylyltransferase
VGDLTAIVCAELEARQAKRRPVLDRMFGRFRRRRGGAIAGEDFIIDNDRINVPSEHAFENDPVNLIRLFWLAGPAQPADPPGRHQARHPLPEAGQPEPSQRPGGQQPLPRHLTSRNAPEVVLRRMNEAGVLGRFIPISAASSR